MWRRDGDREEEHEAAKPSEAPAPAPVVSPGSLAWASAVGNQTVARVAAAHGPEEEGEAKEPHAEGEAPAEEPEEEEEADG